MTEPKKGKVPRVRKKEDTKPEKEKKGKFKRFIRFMFPPKLQRENILQYILRQFFVPDSSGRPSITVSILFFVMAIVAAVTAVEIENAKVLVKEIPHGFSSDFMYLVIGLSIVITGWYRQRQNKINGDEPGERSTGLIGTVKNYITEVISNVKNEER